MHRAGNALLNHFHAHKVTPYQFGHASSREQGMLREEAALELFPQHAFAIMYLKRVITFDFSSTPSV
jgi:hypothetical protein